MRTIRTKRAIMMAVLLLAIAALAVPILGLRARAAGKSTAPAVAAAERAAVPSASVATQQEASGQRAIAPTVQAEPLGPVANSAREAFGFGRPKADMSARIAEAIKKRKVGGAGITPQSGEPTILNARSALSASLMTNIGGRDNQFSEVTLLADWDGREDCVADRSAKVDDFSPTEPDIDFTLTRTAISEHTIANGFLENIFYYGDSVGNVWIGADTDGNGSADVITQINLPTQLNAFGTINSDDQVTITGLAVNPVADLTSFPNVNGAYTPFLNQVGEILYVTYTDSESGLRLAVNNTPVRSGLLAFPIADLISGAPAAPGTIAPAGFPVTVGAAFGVAFSVFSNVAGCAVDDDGSIYFQQVDLVQFTGANIVKVTDTGANQDRSAATSGFITITTLNPTNGTYGTASGPAAQVNLFTNYSGTATTFGNVVALAAGGCNVLYAAVSRSAVATDDAATQVTEGLFANPSALGATPSMIISFADCSGAFDTCSAPAVGVAGTLPVANGFADVAQAGLTLVPGVNNFRVFVIGNGPDIRPPTGGTAVVPGTPSTLLKIDMQIDYSAHNGIAVNEEGTVFVISGGSPGGPGKNPSPMLGEILCFEDSCAADRRADFVDLRGNALPNPPASGGNVGDGDSDRFDHIFFVSPIDQITLTPAGLAGLATGFLRYTNRLAPIGFGDPTLGVTARTQGDDSTSGPIIFEMLDPGHQVAGGDDQNPPFRGDDDNGLSRPNTANNPPDVGPLSGGFEFLFGVVTSNPPFACSTNVWNAFFLNSNGNVTFNGGDSSNTPNVPDFRTGLPKIAPAWTDLNPNSRPFPASVAGVPNPGANTFPVQALGFANVNAFKIRWINVPQFGFEACGSRNTFSVTLYDDGTGIDENANQPLNPANPIGNNAVPFDLQEGPTDLRFALEPTTGVVVPCPSRPNGTGQFFFDYCRMDILGTDVQPVLVGYSIGGLSGLNPPGLCETNLSTAAVRADTGPFGVIDGQTATIMSCLIGEGTEPTIFELFNSGSGPRLGAGGEIAFATPDFDLRFEGNDPALCTPIRQRDLNRGKVGFFGLVCPINPQCLTVTPVGTVAVAPGQPAVGTAAAGSQRNSAGQQIATPTSGIINAVCNVQLNFLGCAFMPNETTTVCQGFSAETGVPLQRPGKTVSSALAVICDTNADGVADLTIPLTAVNPINKNLVRGTLAGPASSGLTGTAFPLTCCGGLANLTLTTTFTAGDNNVFGPFTRTTTCVIDLGVRAPVVISVTPSEGDCTTAQDLLISGACFILPNGTANVTSVFGVESGNPNNVVQATRFQVLNANLVDALFNFGSVNAGKTFLLFVSGPAGTSQNLTTLPAGTVGCPANFLGNQQGVQVTFRCRTGTGTGGGTANAPLIESARWDRASSGKLSLTVNGSNILEGVKMTVNGGEPKKVKLKLAVTTGSNTSFQRAVGSGKLQCQASSTIQLENPGGFKSVPFVLNATCP